MSIRKKKGIAYGISGLVTVAIGVIFFTTDVTPIWVPTVLAIIGTLAEMLGFSTVFPDTD